MHVHDMKWNDDPMLLGPDRRRGVLQFAMYADHLAAGSTLLFRAIKTGTIKGYMLAVATLLATFGTVSKDYRKDCDTDNKWSKPLQAVYDEHDRWMDVPDRREPFTVEMLEDQMQRATAPGTNFWALAAAIADWEECGLFGGFRISEWAQSSHTDFDPAKPALNKRNDTQAFTLLDIRARTKQGRWLQGATIISVRMVDIARIWVRFKTQKNGENGQEIMWIATDDLSRKNFVRPMYNIIKRFVTLRGSHDVITPLSIFQTKTGQIRLITAKDVESQMRLAAINVYKLNPKKAGDKEILQKWSSHSLRVGACVILHTMGATETQLKHLLRWKSSAFMVYLRNSPALGAMQNTCFDLNENMPNFF